MHLKLIKWVFQLQQCSSRDRQCLQVTGGRLDRGRPASWWSRRCHQYNLILQNTSKYLSINNDHQQWPINAVANALMSGSQSNPQAFSAVSKSHTWPENHLLTWLLATGSNQQLYTDFYNIARRWDNDLRTLWTFTLKVLITVVLLSASDSDSFITAISWGNFW